MPREHESAEALFRKLEKILGELRAAATAPPDRPESWTKRTFNPSPASPRQGKFNLATVGALAETVDALRATVADQEARFDRIAKEMAELRVLSETLDAFRERSDRLEAELRSAAADMRGMQERAAALESELGKTREQIAGEMRERIQHLTDEQRVCIRQLSLQASEQAVLADRARRATELKLEELARRIGPPPT